MSSISSQAPHPSPSPRSPSSTHDDQLRPTHHHAYRQHRPQDQDVSYPVNSLTPSPSSVDSVRIPVTNGTNDAATSSGWSPTDTPAPTAPPPTFANQPPPWLQTPPSFRVRLRNFAFAGVKSVKDQLLTPGSLTHLVRAVLVFSLSTLFILVSAIDRWLGPYAYLLPFSSAFCSTAPTLGAHLEGVILALSALAATFGYTWLGRLAAEKCNEHYLNDQGDGDHGGRAILGVWLFLGIFWMSLIRVRDQRYFNPGILFGLPLIIATTYHVDRQAGAVQLVWSLVKPLVFGALFALVVGTCLLPVSATFNLEKQVLRVMCQVMTVIDTTTKSFLLDGSTRLPTAQELNAQMGQVRAAMTVLQRTFLEAKYEITYSSHKPEDFSAIQLTLLKISQHLGSMTLSVQNERFVVYGPCNTGNNATAPPTAASAARSAVPPPLGRVGVVTKELQRADPAVLLRLLDTFGPSIHEMAYLCELTLDRCVHQFIKNCRHLEQSSALPRIVNDVPDNLLIHRYSAIEAHYQEYRNDRSQGIFVNLYRNLLGLRTRHAPPNSVPMQPSRGDAADNQRTNTTTQIAGTSRADNQLGPVPFGSRVPLRRMTDLFTPLKQTVSPPALVPLSRPLPLNPVDPSATTTASTSSNSDVHRPHSTASSHTGSDMDNLCRHVLSNEPLSEADMEAFVRRIQQAITRFDSLEVTTLYKAYHHVEPGVDRDSISEDSLHPRSNVSGHVAQFQEPREEAFLIFFFLFSLREIALLLSTMVEQIHALQLSRSKSQQLRVRWNQDFTRLFRRVRRRVTRRVPGIPVSVDEPPDPRPGPAFPERRAEHGSKTAKGPRHWWSQRRRQQRRTRWRRDREYGKLPGGYTALSNSSESADDSDRLATLDAAQSVRQGLLGRDRQQVSVGEFDDPEDGASGATNSPSARYNREPRARHTVFKPHRRGRATFVSDSSDDNTTFEETFTDRESRSSANEPIDDLAYITTGASPVTSTLSPFRELPAKGLSRWLQCRLWDILCWFRSPPVRYALKISLAITLISFPAWFDHSMYYYSSQKMQWITITVSSE
ncbi:hypothetical protein IWQ60_011534 [Tieghemiomyces parasiticus]|uniref:Putative ER transporter 6TM N-terminal domain-containing protein n=1 Tax=Tieghemiomyces parasiticus TaxID=78921 RepID=A0A9W8DIC9_9FUNG|nr:hypothetical protein IWQ60_011534 [Tieghemiomyces parasiticus]